MTFELFEPTFSKYSIKHASMYFKRPIGLLINHSWIYRFPNFIVHFLKNFTIHFDKNITILNSVKPTPILDCRHHCLFGHNKFITKYEEA